MSTGNSGLHLDTVADPIAVSSGGGSDPTIASLATARPRRAGWRRILREMLRLRRTQVGLVLLGAVVFVALFGPVLASKSPYSLVAPPFAAPGHGLPAGADYLGRDVLSRFLDGGSAILGIALLATVLGVALGALIGLVAGYSSRRADEVLMRGLDVILAFPTVILPLLFIAALGNKWWLVTITVAIAHAPRVARVVRGAALQVASQDFVRYAESIGVPKRAILFDDLLPNVTAPLTVEFGLRMTYSIGIVTALAYLGFGPAPPAPDWGSMIYENQIGVTINAWPVLLPVIAIALLTVGMNLVTDGFGRASAGIDRGFEMEVGAEAIALLASREDKRQAVSDNQPAIDGGALAVEELNSALRIRGLEVDLDGWPIDIVADVDLHLSPGEILGLVGESGSGKTTVAHALLGYARTGATISSGAVLVGGIDVLSLDAGDLRRQRGRVVAYVPQDPSSSLNPALRIGTQLMEVFEAHDYGANDTERRARISELLGDVRLPQDDAFLARYPHEMSGGQQQRVCLAMAFACRPAVVVLDEPTTGLDVSTQAHVLRAVQRLCEHNETVAVYVTHDLAVVRAIAHRIAVMYAGRVVELGPAEDLIRQPAHPYTRGLVGAIPDPKIRHSLHGIRGRVAPLGLRPAGCPFAPRCDYVEEACRARAIPLTPVANDREARCRRADVVLAEPAVLSGRQQDERRRDPDAGASLTVTKLAANYGPMAVLHGVDLVIGKGSCAALVGETGSGKTTLARCIAGLHRAGTGEMNLLGERLAFGARARSAPLRRSVQYVFQNPYSSLNPRRTVGQLIARPLRAFSDIDGKAARARVAELLEQVSLDPAMADRYPSQLSGGERQRVAIARALAAEPVLLVCDEITSALDVSVQASILQLLARLQAETGLTLLFATHNLGVVRAFADTVAVLNGGEIVEHGSVAQVLDHPVHEYTVELMANTPTLEAS